MRGILRGLGAAATALMVASMLTGCSADTAIAVRRDGDVLVVIVRSCTRDITGATVSVAGHEREVLWYGRGEVDLGPVDGDFREIRLDATQFPRTSGSYEEIFDASPGRTVQRWIQVKIHPRDARGAAYGEVALHDPGSMPSSGEEVFDGGEDDPVPVEDASISRRDLCTR